MTFDEIRDVLDALVLDGVLDVSQARWLVFYCVVYRERWGRLPRLHVEALAS